MDNFQKFSHEKLPNKSEFCIFLKDETEFLQAINIWNTFKMNIMSDYHDILLLDDVFEKFVNTCLEYYGLDPCHYFSSPGLSWDAMLKMTGIELEVITDIDMHLFIEKGMRRGILTLLKNIVKQIINT